MSLARAIETGDVAELPSRRDEDWRWSDLRGLVRAVPSASPPGDAAALGAGRFADAEAQVLILNGRHATGGDELRLDAGTHQVVALRVVSQATGTAHGAAQSLVLAPGVTATLLESHEGLGAGYVTSTMLDIRLGQGAQLERIVLIDEAADAVSVIEADVSLAPGASFAQTVITAGAKRQRTETRVVHPGGGASVRMDGLYLPSGARQADITSQVLHQGVDGQTSQLTKGVVRDQARGIFQGRVVVEEGADRTDARMGHHALILSDKAEVDAKPELLIYADDVSCAHGNTVGALDEAALFYAMQRGLPEAEARAMLTEGFLTEVVDRIEQEGAREVVRTWVAERLGVAS